MKHVKTGALIALAAGGLFASACKKEEKAGDTPPATKQPDKDPAAKPDPAAGTKPAEQPAGTKPVGDEKTSMVDCGGVNECKGQGTCKTEKHGCGGQNECKGQGVLKMTEAECNEKGGKITMRY